MPKGGKGRIDLMHVNVPDQDYRGVMKGGKKYYWQPWRKYLGRRRIGGEITQSPKHG